MSKDGEPSDSTNTDCGPGNSEVSLGSSELEAPRKPRSTAQIAAFEKARAKRAENMASKNNVKTPPSTPCGADSPSSHGAHGAHGATSEKKPRKPRSDKGKRRGYLVRERQQGQARHDKSDDSGSDDDNVQVASYYNHFVIV